MWYFAHPVRSIRMCTERDAVIRDAAWRQWAKVSVLVRVAVSGMLRSRVRMHPGPFWVSTRFGREFASLCPLVFHDGSNLTRALWSPPMACALQRDYSFRCDKFSEFSRENKLSFDVRDTMELFGCSSYFSTAEKLFVCWKEFDGCLRIVNLIWNPYVSLIIL